MSRPRHAFLSSLLATCAVAFLTAVPHSLEAASSYFMIQGPLSPVGGYETYKFRVEYTGVLSVPGLAAERQGTGYALIGAIFGTGSAPTGGMFTNSVGSAQFSGTFLSGFGMGTGSVVTAGWNYPADPQWNYFVSGGSYVNTYPPESPTTGPYDNSAWTSSYTGSTDRYIINGSIDAWSFAQHYYSGIDDPVYGPIFFPPLPTGVNPTLGDFTGSGYMETLVSGTGLPYSVYRITAVPEPGRMLLCLLGVTAVISRRSRRARF